MFKAFFRGAGRNFFASFRGTNLLWHALAILLTYLCVVSGFDWFYFEHTRSATLFVAALPAAIIGFFVPVLVPLAFWFVGKRQKNIRLQTAGAAVAQAEAIAWVIVALYKTFTGRIQPYYTPYYNQLPTVDNSHAFNFGFFRHGIFWGWPSSHTVVAVAGAVALACLYPQKKLVRLLCFVYAAYIALGVSVSIHWFSDALAGVIVGAAVGVVVARSYREKARG